MGQGSSSDEEPGGDDGARMARQIYRARRLRDELFDSSALFGEPAWDILLDTWDAHHAGKRHSVSSACLASGAAASTALRKIVRLEAEGLLTRTEDPADRRRAFIGLTELGVERMREFFARLAELG